MRPSGRFRWAAFAVWGRSSTANSSIIRRRPGGGYGWKHTDHILKFVLLSHLVVRNRNSQSHRCHGRRKQPFNRRHVHDSGSDDLVDAKQREPDRISNADVYGDGFRCIKHRRCLVADTARWEHLGGGPLYRAGFDHECAGGFGNRGQCRRSTGLGEFDRIARSSGKWVYQSWQRLPDAGADSGICRYGCKLIEHGCHMVGEPRGWEHLGGRRLHCASIDYKLPDNLGRCNQCGGPDEISGGDAPVSRDLRNGWF